MAVKPMRPATVDPDLCMPDSNNDNEADSAGAVPPLMPGEVFKLPPIVNVQYRDHRTLNLKPGSLLLTNYRFMWVSNQVAQTTPQERIILDMPLTAIFKIDKPGSSQTKTPDSSCLLAVQGKDMQSFTFVFPASCYVHQGAPQTVVEQSVRHDSPRRLFYDKLRELAFTNVSINVREVFAYSFYKAQPNYPGDPQNGWDVYNPKEEFKRLGVAVDGSVGGGRVSLAAKNDGIAVNATWRLTMINDKHKVADTYPAVLCVPASADDDLLRNAAEFRTKRRLPVLSWLHPITGASITRSSQPMTGISNRRNVYDERYLKMILDTNPHSAKLMIVDARPQVNAIANRGKGGGYEIEENYQDIEFQFFDVDNIHVMRESLRKLCDICSPRTLDDASGPSSTQKDQTSTSVGTWRAQVEQTKWLEHVKSTIAGALRVVDFVNNQHYSVLVHCSDGWDRTAQITSLAQLMLDPYYRTINGFAVLVEKEWISMGHRFALRIGVGEEKLQERSPIFLQFIDAVWQLTEQFPRAFEFNERFLIFLLDQLYSGVFGTFLFNSELDLVVAGAKRHTHSVWTHVWHEIDSFLNPAYCLPTTCDDIIEPITSLRFIKLWTNYYCRWDPNLNIAFADGGAADAATQQKELIAVKDWLEREVQRLRMESRAVKASGGTTTVTSAVAMRRSESTGTDADEVDRYRNDAERAPPKVSQRFKPPSNTDYDNRRPSQQAENAIARAAGSRTATEASRGAAGSTRTDNAVLSAGSAPSSRRAGKHVLSDGANVGSEIPYENL